MKPQRALPFLRVPPFPGAKVRTLQSVAGASALPSDTAAKCIELLRAQRVGGTYWGAQPTLPDRYLLVEASEAPGQNVTEPIVRWDTGVDEFDPWHMLAGATAFVGDPNSEAAIVAVLLQVPLFRSGGEPVPVEAGLTDPLAVRLPSAVVNPFSGKPMELSELIELSGHWRRLIDANRSIGAAVGFAFWKQAHVAPLLWGGGDQVEFKEPASPAPGQAVAVWRVKAAPATIRRLERRGVPLIDVEDGFLRSAGLGADCVPPLSIVADRLGAYFDHQAPSELEGLLETGRFDSALLARAKRLRETIVDAGLGKYERGAPPLERPAGGRCTLLVTGQVEDDRSVLTGGLGLTNLEVLQRARADAPDAHIIYKPHPDVEAGHRTGAIAASATAQLADQVAADQPIAALLDMVDGVHVNSSLSGFEALLRGKAVTVHGVPFYAGWGLTIDRGPVPARRTRRLSLDELVAATLLLYPRYLDPLTGLPCPAEIVVERLCAAQPNSTGLLVASRRLQGKLRRGLRRLVA